MAGNSKQYRARQWNRQPSTAQHSYSTVSNKSTVSFLSTGTFDFSLSLSAYQILLNRKGGSKYGINPEANAQFFWAVMQIVVISASMCYLTKHQILNMKYFDIRYVPDRNITPLFSIKHLNMNIIADRNISLDVSDQSLFININ